MNGVEKRFPATSCYICNRPNVLHWCPSERDRSEVPMLQVQTGVWIRVARVAHKIGTRTVHRADVLAPGRSKLETIWLFVGETQLAGCLIEQKGCPLE